MTVLKAQFELVTPAFLGDGGQNTAATTLRPPSIKGALRFWWRAAAWPSFRAKSEATKDSALHKLHSRECDLFGTAAHEGGGRQGVFLLDIIDSNVKPLNPERREAIAVGSSVQYRSLQYLLGQGLWSPASQQQPPRCSA